MKNFLICLAIMLKVWFLAPRGIMEPESSRDKQRYTGIVIGNTGSGELIVREDFGTITIVAPFQVVDSKWVNINDN